MSDFPPDRDHDPKENQPTASTISSAKQVTSSETSEAVSAAPASALQRANGLIILLLLMSIAAVVTSFWLMNRRLVSLETSLRTLENTLPTLPQATIDAIIALQSDQVAEQRAASNTAATNQGLVSIDNDAYIGDRSSAKLALVEFSDFNCPYCARFHSETLAQIMDKYVRTGEMIYVYRDYVGVGGNITLATAVAAECLRQQAGDQVYLDLVSALYAASGRKTASLVSDFAAENGVDAELLASCVEDNSLEQEVVADTRAGQAAGVRGTPGFIVGRLLEDGSVEGVNISGAQPFAYFDAVIQQQLADLN